MDPTIQGAIIAGVFGLAGVLIGLWSETIKTRAGSRAAKRADRHKFLIGLMESLQAAIAEYEVYLANYLNNTVEEAPGKHAAIIGKAMAACLAAGDTSEACNRAIGYPPDTKDYDALIEGHQYRLKFIGVRRLTRNYVTNSTPGPEQQAEVKIWGEYPGRNRDALIDATITLAQLIREVE
ncbi:MAG: hypothetical protein JW910_06155 [Anaerolineae bacterium]|nr:hypothetical protein [Anaerolineae bacterium]